MFIGMLISCLLRWNQQLRWLVEFLMCIIGPPYYGGSYKITIVSLSVRLSDFLHDGIVTFVNIVMKFFFGMQINFEVFYKLILSFWVFVARFTQSTHSDKFPISLQYLGKTRRMKLTFSLYINKVSSNWYHHLRCVCPGISKLPKLTSLLFLCNTLRKKWVMKLILLILKLIFVCR